MNLSAKLLEVALVEHWRKRLEFSFDIKKSLGPQEASSRERCNYNWQLQAEPLWKFTLAGLLVDSHWGSKLSILLEDHTPMEAYCVKGLVQLIDWDSWSSEATVWFYYWRSQSPTDWHRTDKLLKESHWTCCVRDSVSWVYLMQLGRISRDHWT